MGQYGGPDHQAPIFEPGYWSDLNVVWNAGGEGLKVEWPFGFGKTSIFATFDQWEDTLNPRADYAIGEVYAVGSNYGYDALFVNTEEGTIAVGGSRGYPKYKETDCSGQPYLYPYC